MSDIDKVIDSEENERRRSFRLDMEKELIDLVWTDGDGREQCKKVACLDFSRGGLKVDCDCYIAANTPVTVIFKSRSLTSQKVIGKVIRCSKQKNGWFDVAMQFIDLD